MEYSLSFATQFFVKQNSVKVFPFLKTLLEQNSDHFRSELADIKGIAFHRNGYHRAGNISNSNKFESPPSPYASTWRHGTTI